uniref:Uncharacterized protein n=1 Tax=Octopus bimaculoides TaxID=37653 RepID=A0A0L8GU89_OCTBM
MEKSEDIRVSLHLRSHHHLPMTNTIVDWTANRYTSNGHWFLSPITSRRAENNHIDASIKGLQLWSGVIPTCLSQRLIGAHMGCVVKKPALQSR